GIERCLRDVVSAIRPGREYLGGEIRRTFDRALGDDRLAAGGDEDQIGLHDAVPREDDVDGSVIDASQLPFLDVAIQNEEQIPRYPLVPRRGAGAHFQLPVEALVA